LPNDTYGFHFKDGKEKREESLDEEYTQELFPDVTVRMPNGHFTHRFVWTEYPESKGVRIVQGQTYEGVGCSGEIVGKIGAATMHTEEMNESLQEAGDCLTQEIYEAMSALFDGKRKPKGTFKKKCQKSIYDSILYAGGVYVKKDRRGHGLGTEILRALIHSLFVREELCVDLVLSCPAGDPNPGPAAWSCGFDSLSSYFEEK
jgi:GNAT superfamily N-acetyltransferase